MKPVASGRSASVKMAERLEAVRKREAENAKANDVRVYVQERLERRLACLPCLVGLEPRPG